MLTNIYSIPEPEPNACVIAYSERSQRKGGIQFRPLSRNGVRPRCTVGVSDKYEQTMNGDDESILESPSSPLSEVARSKVDNFIVSTLTNKRNELMLSDFHGDTVGQYLFSKYYDSFGEIVVIDANGCYFGAETCQELAHFLTWSGCRVETIFAEWNRFGSSSPQQIALSSLATAIGRSSTLTHLDLRNNNIGPEGALALCNGIQQSTSLTHVDLRWNELGDAGGDTFLEMLTEKNQYLASRKLAHLHLSGNSIAQNVLTKISVALHGHGAKSCESINLFDHTAELTELTSPKTRTKTFTPQTPTICDNEGLQWRASDLKEQLESERSKVTSSGST
jgi:hypothetical protein